MKLVRLLLIGLGVVVVLLALAVGIAFTSSFQTWAARKALAGQPSLEGSSIASVSAGFKRVELKNARFQQDGAVLTLPAATVDLPVLSAGLRRKILITRLVAKGWVLDLTHATPPPEKSVVKTAATPSRDFSLLSSAVAAVAATPVNRAEIFRGVFAQLQLPCDLTLDGLELEGEVILPAMQDQPPLHVKVTATGGGLAAGREGSFAYDFSANSGAGVAPISAHALHGTLAAAMDTPHSFTRISTKAEASVSGTQFPRGVKLNIDLVAARDALGESYVTTLASEGKQLAAIHAEFPLPSGAPAADAKLSGTWKLNLRDADLAPFVIGLSLPIFEVMGDGSFESDATFVRIHTTGKINANVEKLANLKPELAVIGDVHLAAAFDVAQQGDVFRIERLTAEFSGEKPVASVRALQAFEFNPKTGELTANPTQDLVGIVLQGVPLAWAQPFVQGYTLSGGDLQGEFVATAGGGGLALRPKTPLVIAGLSVARVGKPLLEALDVSVSASADYTPQGWQVMLAPFLAKSRQGALLSLDAKAGQLAGKDRPIKSTGKLIVNLPVAFSQPVLGSGTQLTAGDATIEFSASLNAKQEIQAKLAINNLTADPTLFPGKLPMITTDLRADREANGKISLNLPVFVERDGRKSDLNLTGSLVPEKTGYALDAHLNSTLVVVDDVKILAAPFASPANVPGASEKNPPRDAAPPWAGLSGQLTLTLKKIVYSDTFEVADFGGVLRFDAGAVKLEGLRAGLGETGQAKINGGVTFNAKVEKPYALALDLAVTEFDPAPLFRAINPGQPATVEGKFNVTSKLSGHAASLADMAEGTGGDFEMTSKGGIFRGLPVSVASKAELTSRIAAGVASLGNLATVLTGKSDKNLADITNVAQAAAEVTKFWQAISYDQLSVVLARDDSLNTVLKDFTLIAPEIRLTGAGQATHKPGAPLLEEALAMEMKLRARGHQADLLKYIGVLDAQPDALGYFGCTLPLRVSGTLGKPDTSELQRTLENIVLEKTGMTDKASELLNKLLGK